MSETTERLFLPYLMPAQAQKHVTVNEALRRLDALVQGRVSSRTLAAEPASPAPGDAYILPAGASGTAWDGFAEHDIAVFQDGAWERFVPNAGWQLYVEDEAGLAVFDATAWRGAGELLDALENLARLGVGTAADGTNPFSARLNGALWTALESGAGGTGDLRYTLNKEGAANVLSLLFQSGWSGRAEIGLVGGEDLSVKVSADGAAWIEALRIDRASGALDFASGPMIAGAQTASMVFTPGGDGVTSLWRIDRSHGALPRSASIASVAGDVITLSTGDADLFFDDARMNGVSRVRIWNTTKVPDESAWVRAVPDWASGRTQLQVADAADIAGWSPGETIQVGETAPSGAIVAALDIAPMLENVFGAAFRQSGLMVKASLVAQTAGDSVQLSPSGTAGSYIAAVQTAVGGQAAGSGVTVIPCTELSPISDSNLVFLREVIGSTATVELVSSFAVYR